MGDSDSSRVKGREEGLARRGQLRELKVCRNGSTGDRRRRM